MSVTISGSGQLPVQVVQTVKTDTFSTSSGSYVNVTGLSASITPTNSANKILVLVNIGILSAASTNIIIGLTRAGTQIYNGDASGSIKQSSAAYDTPFNYGAGSVSISYVDSPATTSSTTYQVQISTNGSATGYLNRTERDSSGSSGDARGASSIILMEIAYA